MKETPKLGRREMLAVAAGGLLGLHDAGIPLWSQQAQDRDPIKVDVSLVIVNATVSDHEGRAAVGLSKGDFSVYEDGILQDVAFLQSEDVPVSLGILFDTSGSMVDKIDEVQDAVRHFVATTNPDDDIFLLRFSNKMQIVRDFTDDRPTLRKAIGRLRPGGGTALYDAVIQGLKHVRSGLYRKKALLLVTDGNDTGSRATLHETVTTAQESEAIIYALGIGHGEQGSYGHRTGAFRDEVDADALLQITDATGGRTFVLQGAHHKNGVDQVEEACLRVSAELRTQYTLGYYPINTVRDGKYRRIEVKVTDPRYIVRTRTGYLASKVF